MPFPVLDRMTIRHVPHQIPASFIPNIHREYFSERPYVAEARPILGQETNRRYSKSNTFASEFSIWQETCGEPLHIFVIGPSIYGKRRLIEYASNRPLQIPPQNHIYLACKLNGFLLQGVDVEINLWHVGNMQRSLGILQDFYQQYKTCFMLVYDVNDSSTFYDAHQWIPSLRRVLGYPVPIVLVGYEDYEDTLISKMTPVSYSDGMKAKENFQLMTFYEFSDMTGPAVVELVYDAAHIALESKVMTPDSELAESNGILMT